MNNIQVNGLCELLKQEIIWIESLNALLLEERELLAGNHFNDQLESCANKKQDLSKKLEESAKERMLLINKTEKVPSADLCLNEFLSGSTEADINQVKGLNSKLAELLATCRELNSVNGQVIANNVYVRQEIMNTLSGNKADAVSIYNSHGSMSSNNNNRHHEEA